MAAADPDGDEPAAWIRRHLPVTVLPTLPELRLHVASPRSGLGRFLASYPDSGPPYWAHPWAGGLVLARHLLDHAGTIAGRRVLDLGSGSGIVSIAAALRGGIVHAVDVDPFAVAATAVNAALNAVAVRAECADILGGTPYDADVILVGDLFYEAGLANRVMAFLERSVAAGSFALIGDPGRATLPAERLELIDRQRTRDFGSGTATVPGAVYRFRGERPPQRSAEPVFKVTLPGSASA